MQNKVRAVYIHIRMIVASTCTEADLKACPLMPWMVCLCCEIISLTCQRFPG